MMLVRIDDTDWAADTWILGSISLCSQLIVFFEIYHQVRILTNTLQLLTKSKYKKDKKKYKFWQIRTLIHGSWGVSLYALNQLGRLGIDDVAFEKCWTKKSKQFVKLMSFFIAMFICLVSFRSDSWFHFLALTTQFNNFATNATFKLKRLQASSQIYDKAFSFVNLWGPTKSH